ncbi:MAG: hypothetical protein PHS02_03655 [Candidatus ainarchaeum sp.]|nr:hypothetical protein [Candidatus ainarchaeum sp.]
MGLKSDRVTTNSTSATNSLLQKPPVDLQQKIRAGKTRTLFFAGVLFVESLMGIAPQAASLMKARISDTAKQSNSIMAERSPQVAADIMKQASHAQDSRMKTATASESIDQEKVESGVKAKVVVAVVWVSEHFNRWYRTLKYKKKQFQDKVWLLVHAVLLSKILSNAMKPEVFAANLQKIQAALKIPKIVEIKVPESPSVKGTKNL